MNRCNTILLLLILLLSLSGCFQQGVVSENSSNMFLIEDKSGMLTFDEIRDKNLSTEWTKAKQGNSNFGFTKSAIWLSLPFENLSELQASMLLEVAFPLHDSIDVYLLDGKELVKTYRTGDQRHFSERPLNHRHFLFPHSVSPHQKLRAVVRLQSTEAMYIPAKVWESNAFFTTDQHEILLLGVFFGFLSIMLVYNLFLYFSTRHKNYLYYVGCTASIIYVQLAQKGLGYQYFWPDQPFFNHMSIPISSFIMMATSSFFILNFLDLDKKQHAKTILTFQVLIGLSLAAIICGAVALLAGSFVIPHDIVILTTAAIGAIATIIVMILLVNLSIRGNSAAQILTVAWLSLLAGSLLFALGRIGLPLPMLLTENAMLIGSTFEAALISFALGRHIKIEREARMQAQGLALDNERKSREAQNSLLILQSKTTQQLEAEVKERTQKLESAMQELTTANQQLDNLSRLDGLTGLSNRRNFDQVFNEAWRTCSEQKQPMSLLMTDIDHFKSINDTYGHLFGDKCLIKVAEILKYCVNQPENLTARFGGEEFIIMMPGSDTQQATALAELIRHSIENLQLSAGGKIVKFTISIGIASVIPTPGISFVDLNESADQALYYAKENGRNRVVSADSLPSIAISSEEADVVS